MLQKTILSVLFASRAPIFPIDLPDRRCCLIRFTMRNSSKIAQPDVIPHQRSQLPIYHCGHIHFGLVVVCHSYRIAE